MIPITQSLYGLSMDRYILLVSAPLTTDIPFAEDAVLQPFLQRVNTEIARGYRPQGGIAVSRRVAYNVLLQALFLPEEIDPPY